MMTEMASPERRRFWLLESDDDHAALFTRCFVHLDPRGSVERVGWADEALTRLHQGERPDIIVLELDLPGMTGLEFLEQVREHFRLATRLIVFTSLDSTLLRIRCRELGVAMFLTKPLDAEQYRANVRLMLLNSLG